MAEEYLVYDADSNKNARRDAHGDGQGTIFGRPVPRRMAACRLGEVLGDY